MQRWRDVRLFFLADFRIPQGHREESSLCLHYQQEHDSCTQLEGFSLQLDSSLVQKSLMFFLFFYFWHPAESGRKGRNWKTNLKNLPLNSRWAVHFSCWVAVKCWDAGPQKWEVKRKKHYRKLGCCTDRRSECIGTSEEVSIKEKGSGNFKKAHGNRNAPYWAK